jgi:hypothetical protein
MSKLQKIYSESPESKRTTPKCRALSFACPKLSGRCGVKIHENPRSSVSSPATVVLGHLRAGVVRPAADDAAHCKQMLTQKVHIAGHGIRSWEYELEKPLGNCQRNPRTSG